MILIHACLEREAYVNKYLIPSMLEQGIKRTDIRVWMDYAREGALLNTINSFRATSLMPGATWHVADDVVISKDFAKTIEQYNDGIVCGFGNADWDKIDCTGTQPIENIWYSFQCIRIPNDLAGEFVEWYLFEGKKRYADKLVDNKNDDYVWREWLKEYHSEMTAINLNPNIVDHIDYLLGGSIINRQRLKVAYRSAYWENESIVTELEQKLKNGY